MCVTGKTEYPSPQLAWRAARFTTHRETAKRPAKRPTKRGSRPAVRWSERRHGPATAYRCNLCHLWHTTSTSNRRAHP